MEEKIVFTLEFMRDNKHSEINESALKDRLRDLSQFPHAAHYRFIKGSADFEHVEVRHQKVEIDAGGVAI